MHFEAHAQRQVVAVVAALQDGLHHAMHQRGQRHLRMPGDFDLQRGGAVGAQALRQGAAALSTYHSRTPSTGFTMDEG